MLIRALFIQANKFSIASCYDFRNGNVWNFRVVLVGTESSQNWKFNQAFFSEFSFQVFFQVCRPCSIQKTGNMIRVFLSINK